ncbi:gephyrin-like molybdotransferase receptor GlpR [Streptomyces sp. MK5]|uniref:divisome protein SepX/GlpR n=1 Tax=Streptomyces sp. MK5 TaxID=3064253 RepID=UPI002740A489|nr:gephyrin-like molybdotransferase receptor GlpR [Streptomyces sp. MK5]
MSSSGLIYAVIVGAWAAYLVPMWLRRQDELNEARPTERFSTAIRLLSGRAGMERRYARDLRARSAEEGESSAVDPDAVTDSVDVRAFAMPPTRAQEPERAPGRDRRGRAGVPAARTTSPAAPPASGTASEAASVTTAASASASPSASASVPPSASGPGSGAGSAVPPVRKRVPAARRAPGAEAAAARARRTKVLARRRRTTVVLFLAFTLGAIVAAVGGLAFLWAPGVPAVLLSAYIAYLRVQERRRFAYQMDRRRAEAAAQRLRESRRPQRRRAAPDEDADEPEAAGEPEADPGLSALAADRRALVEQTDHAEWLDQQRERRRRPGHGDSWDPVPVPLPTYVTAPVAPRASSDVDLGTPDSWSSARSSAAVPEQEDAASVAEEPPAPEEDRPAGGRGDARPHARGRSRGGSSAASARRSRERGRTPLFDQYEDGERPRAANE